MKIDFTDAELSHLHECVKGTHLIHKLPKEFLDKKFNFKNCIVLFNPVDDYVTVGEISIPLSILFEMDEVINSWGIVVKTIQALECQNYVANRFFSFPSFILKEGIIKLDKELFVLHTSIEQIPLFTIVETKDLVKDVKTALHNTPR